MATDTFTCDHCKQSFPRDTSDDAEAAVLAEAEKRFGYLPPEGRAVVCNSCYAKFIADLDRRIAEVLVSDDYMTNRTLH
jgi:hypothetical protein